MYDPTKLLNADIAGLMLPGMSLLTEDPYHGVDICTTETPLTTLLAKERFAQVSADAKTILEIIFDAPDDLWSLLCYRGVPNRHRIYKYLRSLGWRHGKVCSAFNELKQLTTEPG